MPTGNGTVLRATVSGVTDGDTIDVQGDDLAEEETLRILALDTEESSTGLPKPKTPWGVEAKNHANEYFNEGDEVQLEFPGDEDLETCLQRYRGNFGRLLVYVFKGSQDYQAHMIEEGYSPYFVKYGYAHHEELHRRYTEAERHAQSKHIGVWNQKEVNGEVMRPYKALTTWWHLRARVIDGYRDAVEQGTSILNPRLDYATIVDKAEAEETVTVFSDMRRPTFVSTDKAIIPIGSQKQPFKFYLPRARSESGQEVLMLLQERYIAEGVEKPARSYGYVEGKLKMYEGEPEMVLTSADQLRDRP